MHESIDARGEGVGEWVDVEDSGTEKKCLNPHHGS